MVLLSGPTILTSMSRKPPSATSNISPILVPDLTLSKKHSSAWASTVMKYDSTWDIREASSRGTKPSLYILTIYSENDSKSKPIFLALMVIYPSETSHFLLSVQCHFKLHVTLEVQLASPMAATCFQAVIPLPAKLSFSPSWQRTSRCKIYLPSCRSS